MKISSSLNKYDREKSCQTFKGPPLNPIIVPEVFGTVSRIAGEYIGMSEQKLILSTASSIINPAMDLKYADKDKKVDSAIKTFSKAVVGGMTGVIIRALCIKYTLSHIGFNQCNKFNTYFLPSTARAMLKNEPEKVRIMLEKYSKNLGAILAMIIMMTFTNSNIDVPLTSDLQDFISGMVKDNKNWKQSLNSVLAARQKKINKFVTKIINFVQKSEKKVKKIAAAITDDDSTEESRKL